MSNSLPHINTSSATTSNQSSNPIRQHRPRSSSLSLSIARSPSVLSSGLFFPPSQTVYDQPSKTDLEDEINKHANIYGIHPYATNNNNNQLRKIVSVGPGPTLSPIIGSNSEEDLSLPTSQENDHVRQYDTPNNVVDSINQHMRKYGINPQQQQQQQDENVNEFNSNRENGGLERPLASRKVSFPPHIRQQSLSLSRTTTRSGISIHSAEEDIEMDYQSNDLQQQYEGPFQPPDSKELFSIILSIIGVIVLAVAAGCTTIFDWVL
ncbi:uncharacterized protein L201_006535 [Kwoniella dendrophila CBS 6074]|uniref:Uncharacterized protein n=1 Tax=Kwoniella dendrophila CBS 6074 TaxID=1295534 RepID=A0AAX4K2H7_9TREE